MKGYEQVVGQYRGDCRPLRVEALGGAGGFSGAQFWRLETPRGALCLRRWPREHPHRQRLEFIHQVLRHAQAGGFHLLPLPIPAESGRTYVEAEGHLWEIAPWLPGAADYHSAPSEAKLAAALRALAEFHRAAEDFVDGSKRPTTPPAIAVRQDAVEGWLSGDVNRLQAAIDPDTWPDMAPLAQRCIDLFRQSASDAQRQLRQASSLAVTLQPCIRDIWDQHVLYCDQRVTGIVDFGAMKMDTVATDVARLLGSMARDDSHLQQIGLEAYQAVRPLSLSEQQLVPILDSSSALLAGMNWLRWIYLEDRKFANKEAVFLRFQSVLRRLERPPLSETNGLTSV